MSCGTAGEELPAAHHDIDVVGTELDAEAHAQEYAALCNKIAELPGDHWRKFAAAMPATP